MQMAAAGGKMRVIKERGIYVWQANHLWSIGEPTPEGRERPKWKLRCAERRWDEWNSLESTVSQRGLEGGTKNGGTGTDNFIKSTMASGWC